MPPPPTWLLPPPPPNRHPFRPTLSPPRRPRPNHPVHASLPTPSNPPSPDHIPPGILPDSILELKWKNEAQHLSPPSAPSCPPAPPSTDDDLSASDPYQAFAQFTRIAAPTAAFDPLSATPPLPTLPRAPTTHAPYSTASIAYRLMRYTYARKNLADFIKFFVGEFDNWEQVEQERAMRMLPGEGGGHEHIHCSVVPLAADLLFARYYFNGDPRVVFRSRLYRVHVSDTCTRGLVEMRIFRFYEETERKLKQANYDMDAIQWHEDDVYDWLRGCEVYWERYQPDPATEDDASKRLGIDAGPRFVGYMKGGGCELYSRELGGRIRVMDDLLLTKEELWVADRGFDEHGNFVYGNRRGVPYKMKRVHPGGHAEWTLSETAKPPEGYVP